MVVELKSALKNQPLRLALRVALLALVVFWMREEAFSLGLTFLYIALFVTFYLRPPIHVKHFFPSSLVLLFLPFFVPLFSGVQEFVIIVTWGILWLLVMGVKNVVILRRRESHHIAHIALVAILGLLLFAAFSLALQIFAFVLFFLLFREFYLTHTDVVRSRLNLIASVGALLVSEIAWIISFLSINFLAGATLMTLSVFAFHNITVHYIKDTLESRTVIRNVTFFAFLVVVILLLPI